MNGITYREATAEEITRYYRYSSRVTFRHFTMELNNPRAENGVSHRQHSRAKLRPEGDKVMVRHHGKIVEVTATHCTMEVDGKEITLICDLRLKSQYLPPR